MYQTPFDLVQYGAVSGWLVFIDLDLGTVL
jgi:hypothetical protein